MHRPNAKASLYSPSQKIVMAAATIGLTLTLVVTAAMAGTPVPQPPAMGQTFVSDAAKYGFNPQPEPPPGPSLNLNIRMFNPQPEPPAINELLQKHQR